MVLGGGGRAGRPRDRQSKVRPLRLLPRQIWEEVQDGEFFTLSAAKPRRSKGVEMTLGLARSFLLQTYCKSDGMGQTFTLGHFVSDVTEHINPDS